MDQPEYHQRNRNEVDDQQRREEAPVRQHLPEAAIGTCRKVTYKNAASRIGPGFQGGSGWPRDGSRQQAGKHRHEINGDLMLFKRWLGDANHAWKMRCALPGFATLAAKTGRPSAVPHRSRNIFTGDREAPHFLQERALVLSHRGTGATGIAVVLATVLWIVGSGARPA